MLSMKSVVAVKRQPSFFDITSVFNDAAPSAIERETADVDSMTEKPNSGHDGVYPTRTFTTSTDQIFLGVPWK